MKCHGLGQLGDSWAWTTQGGDWWLVVVSGDRLVWLVWLVVLTGALAGLAGGYLVVHGGYLVVWLVVQRWDHGRAQGDGSWW